MEKTNGNQEKKPEGLKNSRYWENVLPKKEEQEPQKLPDCRNGERQKALH
ncbi:MAG: hypothetical protein ACI4U9_00340 [Clostridia bacterium]